ncbi:2-amino-4-hydroxy-6-hydroxymethyldihydropteridine diphosphokinase [Paenibacillus agricola]|uniref:2-amino-4-hydroxy-6-hydroxymethyldihydropteridine diphosphokinase n=1 Tax=Paenibacillus agricola TaxID=2716264 RepID=A0ABX0JGJ4_9BACL|nr:2-amino-4-hydroxy-6-hydroxymethyldihydropteridine diphosphokinase [Paenibacillus agricola]NHN35048.1 2-amino-4-hydroxy-6-hydroxymethyldihydropteridine diphosphokinase [Paenibacillus agricola]
MVLTTPTSAYVALGSNIGDREQYLLDAIACLNENEDVFIAVRSSIYETEPVGLVDQAPFLNMVIGVETQLSAQELFAHMVSIESTLGRTRELRFGPRTIDLDLLLYGELAQDNPELILPHPRMEERAFVLVPLVEAMKKQQKEQADQWAAKLQHLNRKEGVTLWKKM